MSEWAQIITAIGTLLGVIFAGAVSVIAAVYAAQARVAAGEAAKEILHVKDVVHDVRTHTDGLTTALVKSTAKASFAEGKEVGKAEEKKNGNGTPGSPSTPC